MSSYFIYSKAQFKERSEVEARLNRKFYAGSLIVRGKSQKFTQITQNLNNIRYSDYKIIATEPAVKGNTATNAQKDATIETGMLVRVPLFIEQDEEIIVSTKDGKYVSRK